MGKTLIPASGKKWLSTISAEVKKVIEEKNTWDLFCCISEAIYASPDLTPATATSPTPRERFIHKLFDNTVELFTSYEVLLDFPAIAKSKPPKNLSLSDEKLLVFWREAYFNEFYIFHLRLKDFVTRITRSYKHDCRIPNIQALGKELIEFVDKHMAPLIELRGDHVHKARYVRTDEELMRIQLLGMLAEGFSSPELLRMHKEAISNAKKQSNSNFHNFNSHAKCCLKIVLDVLCAILIDKEGNLMTPDNLTCRK